MKTPFDEKPATGNLESGNMEAPAGAEDCVSLASLAMPDAEAGDQMNTPEVGDKVSYTIDGTVTRVEGDKAYVKREAVNGQDVDENSESETPESGNAADDADRASLGSMAGEMDNQ